jgi:hypothetical protein
MLVRTQPQPSPSTYPTSPAATTPLLRVGRGVQLGLAFAIALLATWTVWSVGNWLLDRWQFL